MTQRYEIEPCANPDCDATVTTHYGQKLVDRIVELEGALRAVDEIRHKLKEHRKGLGDGTADLIYQLKSPCMVLHRARPVLPGPSIRTVVDREGLACRLVSEGHNELAARLLLDGGKP